MLNENLDPYGMLIEHERLLMTLIGTHNEMAKNGEEMSKAQKEISHLLMRIYNEQKSLNERISRLENADEAFQTPTNHRKQ